MAAPLRVLPLAMLAASWVVLRAMHAASTVSLGLERAAARLVVALVAVTLVVEAARAAWPRLSAALVRPARRAAFALAAAGFVVAYSLLAGVVHPTDRAVLAPRLDVGEVYGPLTVWPSVSVEWLGLVASVSAGRVAMTMALAFAFAASVTLASENAGAAAACVRRGGGPPRGHRAAAAAWAPIALGTTACAGCLPPFLALVPAVGGALAVPLAAAFMNPTSLAPTLLEAAAPLLALASVHALAGPPGAPRPPPRVRRAAASWPLAIVPFLAVGGLPPGASTAQRAIHDFFLVASAAALVLLVPVLVLVLYYSARYRDRGPTGRAAPPLTRRAKRLLVAGFAVVPAVIIYGLGVVSHQIHVDLHEPPAGTYYVEVTGKQFEWRFTHPDGRVVEDELRVPVDEVVVLNVTTQDVIHSFFVPDLGVKADALPGHTHQTWFRALQVGTYHAHCAEFCGRGHAEMKARVVVEPSR